MADLVQIPFERQPPGQQPGVEAGNGSQQQDGEAPVPFIRRWVSGIRAWLGLAFTVHLPRKASASHSNLLVGTMEGPKERA